MKKDNIRAVIRQIEPQLCENVFQNFVKRITIRRQSRGSHLLAIFSTRIRRGCTAININKNTKKVFKIRAKFLSFSDELLFIT